MITVTFSCGHRLQQDRVEIPICPACGERRVARVKAPPPRFRGVVVGPCAEYVDLPAKPVKVTKET